MNEKALEAAVASAWNRDPNTSDEAAVAYIVRAYLTALAEDEETVERVAKALWHQAGFGQIPGEQVYADRPDWVHWNYEGRARAALKALAEDGAP